MTDHLIDSSDIRVSSYLLTNILYAPYTKRSIHSTTQVCYNVWQYIRTSILTDPCSIPQEHQADPPLQAWTERKNAVMDTLRGVVLVVPSARRMEC